ncbi:MAG: hypothetical protein AAGM38_13600 [Pseudomonadota bacterium]
MSSSSAAAAPSARIAPLDSLRFVCALIVMFAMTGPPPIGPSLQGLLGDGDAELAPLFGAVWSAPAAAVVFFIISGVCVHYSAHHAAGRKAALYSPSFFLKHYCRVLLPAAILWALATPFGVDLAAFNQTALWSVVAVLIYYSLYPALLLMRWRLPSWRPLIGVSLLLALLIATTAPSAPDYASFGPAIAWLLGLPCWLLGCHLAEAMSLRPERAAIARPTLWRLRAAVLAAMLAAAALKAQFGVGDPWTLNAFGVIAAIWIYAEAMGAAARPAPEWLEKAGTWSYSLFLTGAVTAALIDAHLGFNTETWPSWALRFGLILCAAYSFHLLIEAPSHRLARYLGSGVTRRGARRPA